MAAKRKKKTGEDKEAVLRAKLDRQWTNSQSGRKELDWKWFVYDLWVNGDHYAKWDRNTQQIVSTVTDRGKPKIVVNKVFTTLRAVRNFVLRNKPRAEVTPVNLAEDDVEQVRDLNKYLDFLHEKLKLRYKLKESVWHALKYSVGFWQVLWNEDADDGDGEIEINVIDPYDLYIDPVARNMAEARYCVLAVRRTLDDLKEDEKYDQDEVALIDTDDKLAASSLKARLMRSDRGGLTMGGQAKREGTTIVREHWWFEKEKDEDERKLMLSTMAGGRVIRKAEDTELKQMPFFDVHSDVEPLKLYGQGWVKNLIPLNRLINRLQSQIAEWNDIMNKGKWISDKGAGVRIINNENGQIIEKKRGFDVHQANISPISAASFQQNQQADTYLEDIGGAHDASTGRIPAGAMSGRAIEALQIGDSNNLSEVIENVELFLENVYEYILSVAAQKYQFARTVVPLTQSGEREFVTVIGEGASNQVDEATPIPEKNFVDVKITSWLAQTGEVRREVLKELYQLQAIDQATLLEGFNIGNVADIIKKSTAERRIRGVEEQTLETQGAAATAEATAGAEGEGEPTGQGAQAAIAVVRQIVEGNAPDPVQNPTPEFLETIDAFLQTPEAQALGQEVIAAIQTYRDNTAGQLGA
ncbi:MAG: hypothetical protein KAJ75_06865 [Alphaproteobacteria bacterium]|nr:hypothetical protein [Alphaproteobacteria bacterium]